MMAASPKKSPGLAKDPNTGEYELYFAIAGYMLCSSLMLISNKLAVYLFPAPSFVLWAQLAGTAIGVQLFAACGVITVDSLVTAKVKAFLPVALIFLSTIFTNMKTLQYANVETFIVFRCSTPIIISIADYVWLGRELPSAKSWATLIGLLCASVAYATTDVGFDIKGYSFVTLWFFIFCLDQVSGLKV
jgi:GDP-mannose transporter